MNIYQRIILVIGGIGMAVVIFTTLERTLLTSPYDMLGGVIKTTSGMEGALLLLKYICIIAIVKSAIVAALTFSAYVGFKSRK